MMESSSTRRETGSCSKEQPPRELKAVKLSLVCQSSYCKPHLESHVRVSGLQKHKLIDPVKNLQDNKCQKHDRPLMLFCRDDHTCVCFICTVTDHKNHNTVPLREFKLQEMTENQRGAQKHNKDVIKDLKEEITELKKRNTEQQQKISNTEDDLRLIQEKHLKDLSRQQKSSSERSFKFWFLVVGVLFVLSACFILIHNHIQRPEAETLERLESSKTQITELKKRNSELDSDMQRSKAENTEVKKRNSVLESELKFCKAGKTSERPQLSENVSMFPLLIGVLLVWFMVKCCNQSQDITELKKRNNELNLDIQRHEADITELKEKKNYHKAELKKKPWWDLF
ncbi:Tripartite motif-containing protein 47 [Triplophysa tibetana]|uniref:Tripartite motif-containing protein 47 n=1 Tax=Triplophysa tibetana TaxID=1572043 RepID=A0A5A9NM89_9TELE|nr:Tripartite motif-containing protein 47 [Triplophysa tibetana]